MSEDQSVSVNHIPRALPQTLIRAVAACWPEQTWSGWHRYNGPTANKYGSLHHSLIPHACRVALDRLADVVAPLIGDSFIDYDLHAAGLHMIPPSGFLGRHLDAECHPIRPWKRTHSIVCFVDTMQPHDGGELLIEPDTFIVPRSGDCVVFETPGTWHQVLRTSEHAPVRRTLALFAWQTAGNNCHGARSATFREV